LLIQSPAYLDASDFNGTYQSPGFCTAVIKVLFIDNSRSINFYLVPPFIIWIVQGPLVVEIHA